MTVFPPGIQFKYNWRKYQQRVLDELQNHLSDRHLHVIAPPGSGKTILGLEVALRLNKPVLILAPTITIRNQWIKRFCELFLQSAQQPDWISKDIRLPEFMTVVTYQGLHAACNDDTDKEEETENEEETEEPENDRAADTNLEAIVHGLKEKNIQTIIADEAHHLKSEWWHTLTRVKDKIQPVIVGLTATPPYDVSPAEWERYIELNGPVDTEISVPELVIEGDLCPHQDYVYFTRPAEQEYQRLVDFRQQMEKLFEELRHDETIIKAISNHPAWLNPMEQLDWIYNNLSCYSACLVLMQDNKKEIDEIHLEITGDRKFNVPAMNFHWLEILLDFYLFREKEYFNQYEEHRKMLQNKLRRFAAIENKQISFTGNKKITSLLSSSISKLNGIREIVDFEYGQLGNALRLVILTDFIRKEYFISSPENAALNKIGVLPIFEKLRRENSNQKKIGVLSGSVVIIPASARPAMEARAAAFHIKEFTFTAVPFDGNYLQVHQAEAIRNDIVQVITDIFQTGEIEILIGTKSLLGEGWDAPAINSLILASFVGSFVLSNQMRGRAIRTQNGNTSKTGNIWHLVCIDPGSATLGDDFDLLKRRFKSFVGISFRKEPSIENGTGRLDLHENIFRPEETDKKNMEMFAFAADRGGLKKRWDEALQTGTVLKEGIKIPFEGKKDYQQTRSMYFSKTIANFLATLGFALIGYLQSALHALIRAARNIHSSQDLNLFLGAVGIGGILFFGRQTYKAFRLYLGYRDIGKDIHKIGEALLNSLIKAGVISTAADKLKVETSPDNWGAVYCHLEGGSTFEKSLFINALKEIIGPVNNPRYVILRKSRFMRMISQQDYHSVPDVLGRKKNLAEYFRDEWDRLAGSCELIFTRTIEGRKLILKARMKSLAAQFEDKSERISKWE